MGLAPTQVNKSYYIRSLVSNKLSQFKFFGGKEGLRANQSGAVLLCACINLHLFMIIAGPIKFSCILLHIHIRTYTNRTYSGFPPHAGALICSARTISIRLTLCTYCNNKVKLSISIIIIIAIYIFTSQKVSG